MCNENNKNEKKLETILNDIKNSHIQNFVVKTILEQ